MDARAVIVESKRNKELQIKIIPGHFATSHSHVNYYIDMTSVKTKHLMAKNAARELAASYINTAVDTIVCLDGTEIIGALDVYKRQDGNHAAAVQRKLDDKLVQKPRIPVGIVLLRRNHLFPGRIVLIRPVSYTHLATERAFCWT